MSDSVVISRCIHHYKMRINVGSCGSYLLSWAVITEGDVGSGQIFKWQEYNNFILCAFV